MRINSLVPRAQACARTNMRLNAAGPSFLSLAVPTPWLMPTAMLGDDDASANKRGETKRGDRYETAKCA